MRIIQRMLQQYFAASAQADSVPDFDNPPRYSGGAAPRRGLTGTVPLLGRFGAARVKR